MEEEQRGRAERKNSKEEPSESDQDFLFLPEDPEMQPVLKMSLEKEKFDKCL